MPLSLGRILKRRQETELAAESGTTAAPALDPPPPPEPIAVAHFVTPASKLAAAKRGEDVKSLCGEAKITGDAKPGAAICQKCVLAQLRVDDTKTADATRAALTVANQNAARQREDGIRVGERQGQQKAMQEIREAAERRAAEAKKVAVPT